jgi:methionyl-tRNA formyltransferase
MSQLLHETTYTLCPFGAINLHPSVLPKYRGPNPWFWQYYDVEKSGGVTVLCVDRGEDSGDILCQKAFRIELGLPFARLSERAISIGSELMVAALNDLSLGVNTRSPQPKESPSRRARNVRRDEPLVEWDEWPLERVWHVMRGTGDWLDAVTPPSGQPPGRRWQVGEMVRGPVGGSPGTVAQDTDGYYAVHRSGKIRLTVDHTSS